MKLTVDCDFKFSDIATSEEAQHLHGLSFLLSRAKKIKCQKNALDSLVSQTFGLPTTPDLPMASIGAFGDGLDVQNAVWFYADPVHFVLKRDTFSLHDEAPVNLSLAHAERLLDTLNQHFSDDGSQFLRGKSGRWFLKISKNTEIFWPVETKPLQSAIGQNVQAMMPKGHAALQWRKILNEIQMLMHEHPVNQEREKNGELAVSSVWVSGGGELPPKSALKVNEEVLLAEHPIYAGVACLVQKKYLPLQEIESTIRQKKQAEMRMRLESKNLMQPINAFPSWWHFYLECLKKRSINYLVLNLGLHDMTLTAEISLLDLFKFWRKTKPVAEFFVCKKD